MCGFVVCGFVAATWSAPRLLKHVRLSVGFRRALLGRLVGTAATLAVLNLPPNFQVEEIASGCCGMAGSFGYEKEHYEVSRLVGQERLFTALELAPPDAPFFLALGFGFLLVPFEPHFGHLPEVIAMLQPKHLWHAVMPQLGLWQ